MKICPQSLDILICRKNTSSWSFRACNGSRLCEVIEGLFIESWSGSAGYSAEMLTEDGKSWRVEDESTLASSVNIEAEYPALADREEIA